MRVLLPRHKSYDDYDNYINTQVILDTREDVLNFISERGLSLEEAKELVREFKDKGEVWI